MKVYHFSWVKLKNFSELYCTKIEILQCFSHSQLKKLLE
jgi:hypothetical protein